MLTKIAGRVRGVFAGNYPENREDEQFHLNNRGDLVFAQGLPERAELVRLGQSYMSIGTAVAPVTALPTTAAHFVLWNGEAGGGKTYIIDFIGTQLAVSAGAAINLGLAAQLNVTNPITNPAGAVAIKSLSGRTTYQGKGNTKASVTVTNDSAWHPVGNQLVCANTANLLMSVEYSVYGRYLVPPGGMFALASLCNAAGTATATPWVIWHEAQLILG